jgi:hypothetical protein
VRLCRELADQFADPLTGLLTSLVALTDLLLFLINNGSPTHSTPSSLRALLSLIIAYSGCVPDP